MHSWGYERVERSGALVCSSLLIKILVSLAWKNLTSRARLGLNRARAYSRALTSQINYTFIL